MKGVDALMSDTLGLPESATVRGKVWWWRKKPMDLCPGESEGREYGVGTGVDATLMSETPSCLL